MNTDDKVWISQVKGDSSLGDKLGLRWKLFDQEWSPATHIGDEPTRAYMDLVSRSDEGYALDRRSFPEALAVWDRKRFAKVRDFFWANGFVAVKGRLAEILSCFNFGEGGLIPLPVYQEDLKTPEPGAFFLVNFGARKDSLLGNQSNALAPHYVDPATGKQIWTISGAVSDSDIAVSPAAMAGADVWNEASLGSELFMSDAVVQQIRQAKLNIDFQFARCRVVGTE